MTFDKTGLFVVYLDQFGKPRDALVTADWNKQDRGPVNIVVVSNDESKGDQYGRQLERHTSVAYVEQGYQELLANCWMFYADWAHIYAKKKGSSRMHHNPEL